MPPNDPRKLVKPKHAEDDSLLFEASSVARKLKKPKQHEIRRQPPERHCRPKTAYRDSSVDSDQESKPVQLYQAYTDRAAVESIRDLRGSLNPTQRLRRHEHNA